MSLQIKQRYQSICNTVSKIGHVQDTYKTCVTSYHIFFKNKTRLTDGRLPTFFKIYLICMLMITLLHICLVCKELSNMLIIKII